jgi:fluoroacetyl-CoA thioesterase
VSFSLPADVAQRIAGAHGEVEHVVSDSMTAIAAGSGDLPVLATPTLVALMEAAACKALLHHLPGGLTSVGARVDIRHLAPSPVGARITARATVTDVQGAKVTFDVEASHHVGGSTIEIGRGTHVRVVVERGAFLNTL